MGDHRVIGWREWLALPQLGLAAIKAKVDTGARSSSLHVESLRVDHGDGAALLHFDVITRSRGRGRVSCTAAAVDRRQVTDSGGHTVLRWFIRSQVVLAGMTWQVEMNLSDRCNMLFPMLLGRSALRGRFCVDPDKSYVCGRLRPRISREQQ